MKMLKVILRASFQRGSATYSRRRVRAILLSRVFGTHQHMLVRRFSNPIVRRLSVNVVHSHIFLDSFFDQASRCVHSQCCLEARAYERNSERNSERSLTYLSVERLSSSAKRRCRAMSTVPGSDLSTYSWRAACALSICPSASLTCCCVAISEGSYHGSLSFERATYLRLF